MNHRILIPVAVATCLVGCRDKTPPVEEVPASPVAVVAPPAPDGLRRAVEPAFEMAVPAGVTLERRDSGVRHYRISADWADLEAFFTRELGAEYIRTAFSRGARFEARDGSGRAVYLHRERSADAWVLTYFDSNGGGGAVAAQSAGSAAPDGQPGPPVTAAGAPASTELGVPPVDFADTTRPAGSAQPAVRADRPDTSSVARAQQDWPDAYRNRLQEEFGTPVDNGTAAPEPTFRTLGGPHVHPRLRGLVSDGDGGRQPINFVRGVREDRRNPNAEF